MPKPAIISGISTVFMILECGSLKTGRQDREDAELGYMIRKNRQGQGLAYEVCTAILAYAKEELGFEKLFARTRKENLASAMLLKKLGFHPVCAQSETKEADNAQIEYYIVLP